MRKFLKKKIKINDEMKNDKIQIKNYKKSIVKSK